MTNVSDIGIHNIIKHACAGCAQDGFLGGDTTRNIGSITTAIG